MAKSSSKITSTSSKPSQMYLIIISLIILGLLYATYHYLTKLESCACVNGTEKENIADLQKLRYIELFFIAINVIGLINLFIGYQMNNSTLIKYGSLVYTILIIVIYVYLVMHVLRLYKNMPSNCECALQWPRYYLYLQAFGASISLFFMLFAIVISIFLFAKMATMKK
jgi:hypothetical protein